MPDTLDKQSLLEALRGLDRSGDAQWLASVDARKREEAEFHDDKVDRRGHERDSADLPELHRNNKKYYSTVDKSVQFINQWIADHAPGKVVLDYACGQGKLARRAAAAGAELAIGLDISGQSIANARLDAEEEGLADSTFFLQGDCEATGLPDNSVDVIFCSGMLHHLDVTIAFPELHRIMRPGGVCLAVEALDYNPIVKAYRLLTPSLRTEWEKHHILSHDDLGVARGYFEVADIRYWHLLSIATTPLRNTPIFRPALAAANFADKLLLKVPPFNYMAWQFSFELRKAAADSANDPQGALHDQAA